VREFALNCTKACEGFIQTIVCLNEGVCFLGADHRRRETHAAFLAAGGVRVINIA
jgi:hypothetical protein